MSTGEGLYAYIYIYVCVCVCVCVKYISRIADNASFNTIRPAYIFIYAYVHVYLHAKARATSGVQPLARLKIIAALNVSPAPRVSTTLAYEEDEIPMGI